MSDAIQALPKSVFALSLRDEAGQLVGMGRVIGDGHCFLQIVDIAVHPEHRGRGLAHEILRPLLEQIERHAPGAFVSLFADVDYLYQKYGFVRGERSVGMILDRRAGSEGGAADAGEPEE